MLLITAFTILYYIPTRGWATDCRDEVEFHSSLSIESWCMTGIDDCSFGSLNSRFPSLFDAKGWAPAKSDILNVTSFCQYDSKGNNHAGVHVAWKPPTDSGARDIKGFEIRLEGYMPGYRCTVIKLKESLTQSVIHSVITGSFFPLKRRQNHIIMLFSLPRSDNSSIVSQSFYSPRCENSKNKWDWRPKASDFTISYDDDEKELNLSFSRPPDHFRFDQFKLTILRLKPYFQASAVINQTFHMFSPVEAGDYQLRLEPFNPKPYDDKLCKCRDDRKQCVTCLTVAKNFTVSVQIPSGTNLPARDINNSDSRLSKLMTRALLPVCVLVICLISILIAAICVFRRRRKSRKPNSNLRTSSDLGSADDIDECKRYLVLVNMSSTGSHCKGSSYQTEFFHILTGMFRQAVTVFRIKGIVRSGEQLRDCLNKLVKVQTVSIKEKEHDCSETSLIEDKTSSSLGTKLDCCFKQDKRTIVMLVCLFADEHTSTKIINMCKDVCKAMQSDNTMCETMSIYDTLTRMQTSAVGMKTFSYKEQLPVLLKSIKETLFNVRNREVSGSSKHVVGIVSDRNVIKTRPNETVVTLLKDLEIEGKLTNSGNGVQSSQGQGLEIAKRQRYTSNDSGWGTSEHSFRSSPMEDAAGSSTKSSLHFISGMEQDFLSPKSDFCTSIDHSLLQCPSDVYFFPPEDLTSSNLHTIEENTNIMRIKRGPGTIHKELVEGLKTSEKRLSPSVDSLMNMLKAFNDECTHFMENEAKPGDVYSVFEGTV